MITEEMRIAERHRRYQVGSAERRIEYMSHMAGWTGWTEEAPDYQDSPTMRLALHSLMIGSHAHRGTPV